VPLRGGFVSDSPATACAFSAAGLPAFGVVGICAAAPYVGAPPVGAVSCGGAGLAHCLLISFRHICNYLHLDLIFQSPQSLL
jgi:hypothetical protein